MDEIEFEACVEAALQDLPTRFLKACQGVSIVATTLPGEDTLNALGLSEPLELLGLYHGVSLTRKSVLDLPARPDTILIYRLPILAYAKTQRLPVNEVVRHVLVHEIGHHFGFSDEDMEVIERGCGTD